MTTWPQRDAYGSPLCQVRGCRIPAVMDTIYADTWDLELVLCDRHRRELEGAVLTLVPWSRKKLERQP